MRRFLLLAIVAITALAVIYHNRLFLRDPLGKVERNALTVPGARVFINYSNDILVQEDGGRHMFVVQAYNKLPGSPTGLTCIQGMLCVTPSDQAVPGAPEAGKKAVMSDREVSFTDSEGSHVHVTIR